MEQIAKRALEAFLSLTAGNSQSEIALRALVFHMLEGYKPEAFERWNLPPLLHQEIHRLNEIDSSFPQQLPADDGLARVDAIYILHQRKLCYELPNHHEFQNYLIRLDQNGFGLYAYVMSELTKQCGFDIALNFPERPFKSTSRLLDTYWLTHLFLLDTHYLHFPLTHAQASEWTRDLLAATNWVIQQSRIDLAAEIGICLQLAGLHRSDEHQMILNLLVQEQTIDGSVQDLTLGDSARAHTTAATLLFFAGAEEVLPV
jgi:D-amino peptidase